MTKNDQRVLREIRQAVQDWDGYGPHGAADWTAVRRLLAAGLIRSEGVAECQSCPEPHEGEYFVLTVAGCREVMGCLL